MIEVRHLRSFVVLAEELSFRAAAERLHIAQPALTRQIQQLERNLATPLLNRTKRSVSLTPPGANYLKSARRILDQIATANHEVRRAAAGETGTVRVGFSLSLTFGLMPLIVTRFRRLYPDIEIDLRELNTRGQIEALARDEIDAGLVRPPVGHPLLRSEVIVEERFVVAVPPGHPLHGQQVVSLASLAQEPFVGFSPERSSRLYARINAMCEKLGFVPKVTQVASHVYTVVGLVAAGIGVAVVPASCKALNAFGVGFLEIHEKHSPIEVVAVFRRDKTNPALHSFDMVTRSIAEEFRNAKSSGNAPA